jgi:hypothetical protein
LEILRDSSLFSNPTPEFALPTGSAGLLQSGHCCENKVETNINK